MIINKAHDFGFVHIPKCAGSTIRQQLRDLDDMGGRFYHTMTLPDLGKINANHILLSVLDRHFPEDLARLRDVTSYAILREPMDRFKSAVAQHLRAHVREAAEMSEPEIRTETDKIIDALRDDPDQKVIRNTIFYRQSDYVFLHGERIIDHLYPMDDMGPLFDRIARVHGLTIERDRVWNPTVTYRLPGSSGGLKRIKDRARKVLPTRTYAAVRDLGIKVFTTKGVPKLDSVLDGSSTVRDFVAEHYAGDIALYAGLRTPAAAETGS